MLLYWFQLVLKMLNMKVFNVTDVDVRWSLMQYQMLRRWIVDSTNNH